eukprot:scaffold16011_cov126-Isochrysis_galbana.AAC.4
MRMLTRTSAPLNQPPPLPQSRAPPLPPGPPPPPVRPHMHRPSSPAARQPPPILPSRYLGWVVLFGDILHLSLHAPLPAPVLATRDLERPRPSSRSNCMVRRAGLASRASLLAVRLAGFSSLVFIHSAVWLHGEL